MCREPIPCLDRKRFMFHGLPVKLPCQRSVGGNATYAPGGEHVGVICLCKSEGDARGTRDRVLGEDIARLHYVAAADTLCRLGENLLEVFPIRPLPYAQQRALAETSFDEAAYRCDAVANVSATVLRVLRYICSTAES